jgi:hypothetical protein
MNAHLAPSGTPLPGEFVPIPYVIPYVSYMSVSLFPIGFRHASRPLIVMTHTTSPLETRTAFSIQTPLSVGIPTHSASGHIEKDTLKVSNTATHQQCISSLSRSLGRNAPGRSLTQPVSRSQLPCDVERLSLLTLASPVSESMCAGAPVMSTVRVDVAPAPRRHAFR